MSFWVTPAVFKRVQFLSFKEGCQRKEGESSLNLRQYLCAEEPDKRVKDDRRVLKSMLKGSSRTVNHAVKPWAVASMHIVSFSNQRHMYKGKYAVVYRLRVAHGNETTALCALYTGCHRV